MEAVIGLFMFTGAVMIVGYPFLRKDIRNDKVKTVRNKPLGYEEQKEIVMSSIGEIEFDYKMNKLTKDDYRELKALYKEKAVRLLKEKDKIAGVSENDLVRKLEEEIQADLKSLKETDADALA